MTNFIFCFIYSSDSYDKSETLFELNEDSDLDVSTQADIADESKDWDACSEDRADDDSLDDAESMIPSIPDTQDEKSETDSENKITCLSSMCQSGAILACHSSLSSPTSCISNCSCKKSYSSTAINSGLSLSSPSLLCPSSDSFSFPSALSASLPSLNQGNVRTCIPCGSISFVPKTSGQNRKDSCSNTCDTSAHDKPVCDDTLYSTEPAASSEYCYLRKVQSSEDLRTMTHISSKNINVPAGACLQPLQCKASESALEGKPNSPEMDDSICYQFSVMDDVQCLSADLSFSIKSSNRHSLNRSQGPICNNSNTFYSSNLSHFQGSNDFHDRFDTSSSSKDLKMELGSFMLYLVTESSAGCSQNHSLESNSQFLLQGRMDHDGQMLESQKTALPADSSYGNLQNHHMDLQCLSKFDAVHMPATPESVPDIQKFTSRASILVRSHDSFTCSSFDETSSQRFTSKRARLEYSGQQPASGEATVKQSGLNFESDICDKFDDCGMPDVPVCLPEDDCALSSSSRLTLKRKKL